MSNQLDNLFKNKLQNRTYEYDESAWEDARLLIEQDERRKKRKRFAYIFGGMCLLFAVSFSAFYLGKSSVVVPGENIPSAPPSVITTEVAKPIIAEASSSANSKIQADQRAETTEFRSSVSSAKSNKISKKNNSAIRLHGTAAKINDTINNKSNLVDAQGVAINSATIHKPTTTHSNPINVAKATPQLSLEKEKRLESTHEVELMPLSKLVLLPESNESTADLVSLLPAIQKAVEGAPIIDRSKEFFFGLRGGAAIVPLTFMDLEGGFELGYQLNRNWAMSLQPKYQYQSLSENTIGESTQSEYGFGLRASAYSLKAETVRSIHLPIVLSYEFGNKSFDLDDKAEDRYFRNKISFGLAYVYLDGITGVILQKENAGEQSEYQSGWLAAKNFNRHNAEVMIGYDRFLTKRLSIGIQARYRVRDQFAADFTRQFPSILSPSPLYLGLQTSLRLF